MAVHTTLKRPLRVDLAYPSDPRIQEALDAAASLLGRPARYLDAQMSPITLDRLFATAEMKSYTVVRRNIGGVEMYFVYGYQIVLVDSMPVDEIDLYDPFSHRRVTIRAAYRSEAHERAKRFYR